LKYP